MKKSGRRRSLKRVRLMEKSKRSSVDGEVRMEFGCCRGSKEIRSLEEFDLGSVVGGVRLFEGVWLGFANWREYFRSKLFRDYQLY